MLGKKARQNEIAAEDANDIVKDFLRFPLQTYEAKTLLPAAWNLARQTILLSMTLYILLWQLAGTILW